MQDRAYAAGEEADGHGPEWGARSRSAAALPPSAGGEVQFGEGALLRDSLIFCAPEREFSAGVAGGAA